MLNDWIGEECSDFGLYLEAAFATTVATAVRNFFHFEVLVWALLFVHFCSHTP